LRIPRSIFPSPFLSRSLSLSLSLSLSINLSIYLSITGVDVEALHQHFQRVGTQRDMRLLQEMEARLEHQVFAHDVHERVMHTAAIAIQKRARGMLARKKTHEQHAYCYTASTVMSLLPTNTANISQLEQQPSFQSASSEDQAGYSNDGDRGGNENGEMSATNFVFLGPDGSHPSHLVCGLHSQARAGWETTFVSDVLNLNREKMTRELMPLDYYKQVLAENIYVARRMAEQGKKAVLKAKLQVSNSILRKSLNNKEEVANPSLDSFCTGVYKRTLIARNFKFWQDCVVNVNNLNAMKARFVVNRYTDVPLTFPRQPPGRTLHVSVARALALREREAERKRQVRKVEILKMSASRSTPPITLAI
jgi:transposase